MFAWSASSNNRASRLWLAKVVLHSQCQGPLPCSESIHRLPRSFCTCYFPSSSSQATLEPRHHRLPPALAHHLPSAPKSMDNPYFGDRGYRGFQNNYRPDGLDTNHLNVFGQHSSSNGEPFQHQTLSPGQPRSRGSSFTGSPTSPSSAHPVSVSQPAATQSQPSYFPIGTTGAMQPALSPVTPTYDISRSHSINSMPDYSYGRNFGQISMPDSSGTARPRHNSE